MDLPRFVASIGYKPGWRFKLGGPGDRVLCVYAITADSQRPVATRWTQHQFPLPDPLPDDERELCRWLRDRLFDVERHECCEFLSFDGSRPFFPHHQDEGSPYVDVERWEA